MSGDEKKGKTRIGQPPAPTPEAAEEEAAEEVKEQLSQPSPSSNPGGAPSTPEQTAAKELDLTNEVEDVEDEASAEPAPAAMATPPQQLPVAQGTPSMANAPTRQAVPPRKGWFKWPDRWKKADTNSAVLCGFCILFWITIIIIGSQYGAEVWDSGKSKATNVASGAKTRVMHVAKMVMPAKKQAKPAPPPTPLEPPKLECRNYTVNRGDDGSRSISNCKCLNNNCPTKIVCTGDQYKREYIWDEDHRFVESTVVDTSNCKHFY